MIPDLPIVAPRMPQPRSRRSDARRSPWPALPETTGRSAGALGLHRPWVLALLVASLLTACSTEPPRSSARPEEPGSASATTAVSAGTATGATTGSSEREDGEARSADDPLRAAFLVVDGIYNTELIAPFDVFQHVQFQKGGGAGIEVFTISPDGGPVTTFEGLRLTPDYGFDNHPPVDILVVASADGSRDRDRQNERMVEWVRRVGGEARYVMSLCWGAFILGEAGLLDGHAATTFPGDYALFAETFPATEVRVNVSFVQDGRVLTSQGGVRSFDVAMHLVEELFGLEVAQGIGGGLLIPWPPDFSHLPPFEVRRPAPASPG